MSKNEYREEMNILFFDIETSPNLAHVWGIWQQNVGLNQLLDVTQVLCWAAKWKGSDKVLFSSQHEDGQKKMIKKIWSLLNEADVVCHYNGRRFDVPHLNREFLMHGLRPPAPFKQIDLLQTVKKQFRFPSNKLDYVTKVLGLSGKVKHAGHEMWIGCMAGDEEHWANMEKYNRQDVVVLEELYDILVPWIVGHPNRGLYEQKDVCRCGSERLQKRGYSYTDACRYQRYRCKDCGTWFRGRKNLTSNKTMTANVVL